MQKNSDVETDTRLDWRAARAASGRDRSKRDLVIRTIRLPLKERDEFYFRAYSEDKAPTRLLARFAEAYANGEYVPSVLPHSIEHRCSSTAPLVSCRLSPETMTRLRGRAKAEGFSISVALRLLVAAYTRSASGAS
jgi:hypothetical protein